MASTITSPQLDSNYSYNCSHLQVRWQADDAYQMVAVEPIFDPETQSQRTFVAGEPHGRLLRMLN